MEMIAACRLAGLVLAGSIGLPALLGATSDRRAPEAPTNYARLRNARNTPPIGANELAAEAAIERSAQTVANVGPLHLILPTDAGRHAILTDADPQQPHWYEATLDPATSFTARSCRRPSRSQWSYHVDAIPDLSSPRHSSPCANCSRSSVARN